MNLDQYFTSKEMWVKDIKTDQIVVMSTHLQKNIKGRAVLVLVALCVCKLLIAQYNLVPNPSFEQYSTCPSANTRINKPDYWYKPDARGAGYLNSCTGTGPTVICGVPAHATVGGAGFQYARTGNAYVLMFYYNGGDGRNYFQVQLLDSLRPQKCYYVVCYLNLSNGFIRACNNQAVLLTTQPIYADTLHGIQVISANPQTLNYGNPIISDTLNWVKLSGVFTAQGGERYLTLGNFKYNFQTDNQIFNPTGGYNGAAYYVDDVSVIPLDSFQLKADAGPDTTIAIGDSVFIGSLTYGIPNIQWYDMSGNVIDTGRPGFAVHPATTTSYIIEQTVCGYYSRDTVTVMVNLLPLKWVGFRALAVSSSLSLGEGRGEVLLNWQTASEFNVSHYNIQRSLRGTDVFENIGQVPANNRPFNEYSFVDDGLPPGFNGRVLYRIQSIDKDGMRSYSVIRSVVLNGKENDLKVYPNPAKDQFMVECGNAELIKIINGLGQVVLQVRPTSNRQKIVSKNFSRGLYVVQCVQKNGEVITTRVAVQ